MKLQHKEKSKGSFFQKIWLVLLAIGPGIFGVGYTIGTGSVTSMATAGSRFGMQLIWVLLISCIFSWVLMEAYGRFAIVTGKTAINSFRREFKLGTLIAILVTAGIVIAQWNSLNGILALSSNGIYELLALFIPGLTVDKYWIVLGIAITLIIFLYLMLLVGRYSFFEKILVVFVTIMGLTFISSLFIVFPQPEDLARGFIPSIPEVEGGRLLVAAFVGTTMAAPTFIVRPLLLRGKGWDQNNLREQSRDALFSAILMFVISGSVMAAATGAMYYDGKQISKVLDMVNILEPIAGKMAVTIFMFGALSAGISSIFPILMVAPLLIADYRSGELDIKSRQFKILTAISCIIGLIVPILGTNPIIAQIATQVANVFVLPLVIGAILFLINSRRLMGENKAGFWLNLGLITAFFFSCIISWTGLRALAEIL
ncbi:Nramp family divalent metal transporter [soil metagenome]